MRIIKIENQSGKSKNIFNSYGSTTTTLTKIKNIVVALDGSKSSSNALDYAIYLARQNQTTLSGIYVIPMFSINYKKPSSALAKMFIDNGKKVLMEAKIRCAKNGVLFKGKMANGNEGFMVISYAKKKKASIIVMGSRGRSNIRELFLGSVSHYVVHKSPIPVLVVK